MERFANVPVTTLNGAINNSVTSIVVSSTTGFNAVGEFAIRIDDELMIVTAVSGTTWTVVRGAEGSVAASHVNGSQVFHLLTAGAIDRLRVGYRRKNYFHNGLCRVWQKGTSGWNAPTTYNIFDSYVMDRWYVLPTGATVPVSKNAGPNTALLGPTNEGLSIVGATSVTTVDVGQRMSAEQVKPLASNAQAYVASFWVWQNSGGAITPTLLVNSANSTNSFSGVTNRLTQALQSCANNAWTRVYHAFSITGLSSVTLGMEVILRLPNGALSANTKTVIVSGMDLSEGTYPGPMEIPDFEEELDIATMHYQQSYQYGTTPGANQTPGLVQSMGDASGNQIPGPRWRPMRATPSYRIWSKSGTSGKVSDTSYNDYASITSAAFSDHSNTGARILTGSGTFATAVQYNYHYAISAEL